MSLMKRAVLVATSVWLSALVLTTFRAGGAPSHRARAPRDTSLFAHSSECVACHNNLVAPTGEDVSIGASWRGTLMANSARDPYFHASVRRETIDHPRHAEAIEDECAACHMPAAQKIARAAGGKGEIFSHLSITLGEGAPLDALAADGISCTVCHQIAPDRLGTPEGFNGNFVVAAPLANGNRRAFGAFGTDAGRRRIMHSVTGFEQEQAPHVRESELCATCHTLITEAIGPDGRVIGSLPEQMNYQEWRESAFFQERRSCQSCHMPQAEGPVRVASVLGDYRESLSRHTFAGGNAFMLRLMNRYRAELGIEATTAELEAVVRATVRQLENETANLSIEKAALVNGTLSLDVAVENLTGHKFPTGYPSRRAWLHVTVRDGRGVTLFESGRVSEAGLIEGNDSDIFQAVGAPPPTRWAEGSSASTFEPHYEEIARPDEVQIYESIMGTPEGLPTTGLLQATRYLKDNRLLPRGFDKRTAAAEIGVFGEAEADGDFTGDGDRVRYRIATSAAGPVSVDVELRYQSIGYRWARNLASYDAPEPRTFVGYYQSLASSSSIVVRRVSRSVEP